MPERELKLVHVCGTHEMAITEHGLRSLLPKKLSILEGPGCPVCVTPTADLDAALQLADRDVIVAAFGDMMRVPGTEYSLEELKSRGADVRVVYSADEAVKLARSSPEREIAFLSVGFETTAPMTAAVLADGPPSNFSVIPANKLIPPAMEALMELPDNPVDGYLAPGHVSTIIGTDPYQIIASGYGLPVAVAGFEPLDILYAIDLLLQKIAEGDAGVFNAYQRAVDREGNPRSLQLIEEVFLVDDAHWRGIGVIPDSGLFLRDDYSPFDARKKFDLTRRSHQETLPNCLCPSVLTARATPDQCDLFGEECTPEHPHGPCMVGQEAMCNIWYRYGGRPSL